MMSRIVQEKGREPERGKLLTGDAVRAALACAPSLRDPLTRMARRAMRGEPLPASFSASDLDYAAQGELERLLGVPLRRSRNGRVCGSLPAHVRTPSAWNAAAEALGVSSRDAVETVETFLGRLKLLAPNEAETLDALGRTPEVLRHIRPPGNRDDWKRLFLAVSNHVRADRTESTTLSQLGSQMLNDSKALRTGPLRRQLALILKAMCGRDLDERTLFATSGIVDNPYTSFVTVFAPFAFGTIDGRTFDFPLRLFECGQACALTAETVGRIRSVAWQGDAPFLTTSENAAPFARLVSAGRPAVYTEGYPNLAVQRLLALLSSAGVAAEHAGDADLDGFLIAGMVDACLPLRRVVAAEVVRRPGGVKGLPLTEAQRTRAERYVATCPDRPFAEEIRFLLDRGLWYEQEAFPL